MTNEQKIINFLKNHKRSTLDGIINVVPVTKIGCLRILSKLKNENIIKVQKGQQFTEDGFKYYDPNIRIYKLIQTDLYKQQNLF